MTNIHTTAPHKLLSLSLMTQFALFRESAIVSKRKVLCGAKAPGNISATLMETRIFEF